MDAIVAKALECIAVLEAKPDIGGWTTSKVTDMSSVSHKDVDKSSYSFPVGELFPALRDEGPTDTHIMRILIDGGAKRCWQKGKTLEVRGKEAGNFVKSVFGVRVSIAEFQLDSIPRCSFPNTSSQATPREPKRRKVDVLVFETPEKRALKLAP